MFPLPDHGCSSNIWLAQYTTLNFTILFFNPVKIFEDVILYEFGEPMQDTSTENVEQLHENFCLFFVCYNLQI